MSYYRDMLTNDDILIVKKQLACALGLEKAVVIKQLAYWIDLNEKADKESHFKDGKWWAYNTYQDWQEKNFPFLSIRTIRRVFSDLEDMGLVISTKAYNKWKNDSTKWYTVDKDIFEDFMRLWVSSGSPNCANGNAKSKAYKAFLAAWEKELAEISGVDTVDTPFDTVAAPFDTVDSALPETNTESTSENRHSASLNDLAAKQPEASPPKSGGSGAPDGRTISAPKNSAGARLAHTSSLSAPRDFSLTQIVSEDDRGREKEFEGWLIERLQQLRKKPLSSSDKKKLKSEFNYVEGLQTLTSRSPYDYAKSDELFKTFVEWAIKEEDKYTEWPKKPSLRNIINRICGYERADGWFKFEKKHRTPSTSDITDEENALVASALDDIYEIPLGGDDE